jgi:uncharacterized repeat protein (TIGR01451 family)
MPDIYVIGDTIRFTASITNMAGNAIDPDEVTVTVLSPDGTTLLEEATATKVTIGSYRYDWTVDGVADPSKLIVIWDWTQGGTVNKKRMKFKVVPETDY